jgi:hypothetical protein
LLTVHISTAVGLVGVSVVIVTLGLVGLGEAAPETVYPALHTVAKFALVPLELLALATGLAQVYLSGYGLLRPRWVTAKLLITAILTAVAILVVVPGLGRAAEAATTTPAGVTEVQQLTAVVTPAIALALFVLATTLGVFKPTRRR